MSARDDLARRKMLGVLAGSWLAQGCYALAKLGIADAMGEADADVADVARATGTDPIALARLLRSLALAGLVKQAGPDRFALTPSTTLLRRDAEGSVYLNAVMQGDEVFRAFGEITHTLLTGEPAFAKVFGMPFYDYLEANPDAASVFHQSMGAEAAPAELARHFAGVRRVADIGGGNGAVLAEVLRACPGVHGVLCDRPEAVRAARAYLAPFGDRVSFAEGDFFTDALPADTDAYLLCRVLHNWRDDAATSLLRRVAAVTEPGDRLVLAEEFLPVDGRAGGGAGLVDLLMLVTLEGRDRTSAEYAAMVEACGLTVTSIVEPAAGAVGILEAGR